MKLPVFPAAWAARAPPATGLALRSPLAFLSAASRPLAAHPFHAPLPLARWLATRSHSTAAGSTLTVPKEKGGGGKTRAVLVKMGDDAGPFYLLKDPGALGLDGMSLLEALADTKGFAPDLAGVALQRCTVHVCTSASDERPSADEVKTAVPLEGAKTLGALAATAPPGANLFVRVTLPGSAAAAGNSE